MSYQNQPKIDLFTHLNPDDRHTAEKKAKYLLDKYHLGDLYDASMADNYRENLFYLDTFERALDSISPCLPDVIMAADIGPSDWFYVQALYALLKWGNSVSPAGRQVNLSGFEADPYRVYTTFHSRYDHALAHIRDLRGVTYIPQPFQVKIATFDVITMLFPFIFLSDHLAWGLPREQFAPQRLLRDAWRSLKPNGVLIIINQGDVEYEAQRRILANAEIHLKCSFKQDSLLYQYQLPRYVLVAQNNAS